MCLRWRHPHRSARGSRRLGLEIVRDQIKAFVFFSRRGAVPGEIDENCVLGLRGFDFTQRFWRSSVRRRAGFRASQARERLENVCLRGLWPDRIYLRGDHE